MTFRKLILVCSLSSVAILFDDSILLFTCVDHVAEVSEYWLVTTKLKKNMCLDCHIYREASETIIIRL